MLQDPLPAFDLPACSVYLDTSRPPMGPNDRSVSPTPTFLQDLIAREGAEKKLGDVVSRLRCQTCGTAPTSVNLQKAISAWLDPSAG